MESLPQFLYLRSRYICYRKRTVPYRVLAHSHSPTSLYNFNFISQSAIIFHQSFTLCPHLTCERESFGLVLFRRYRISATWNTCCLIFYFSWHSTYLLAKLFGSIVIYQHGNLSSSGKSSSGK